EGERDQIDFLRVPILETERGTEGRSCARAADNCVRSASTRRENGFGAYPTGDFRKDRNGSGFCFRIEICCLGELPPRRSWEGSPFLDEAILKRHLCLSVTRWVII